VLVEVVRADGSLRVTVTDDGRGFHAGHEGDGFGLRGMRERAELLDGRLQVAVREEGGTEVSATLPLARQL